MTQLQKNMLLPLDILSVNDMGNGVARYDNRVIFVTGAVTGDRVLARIIKLTKSFSVARTEEILTPSPDRVENTCTAAGCGGCAYRCLSYEKEKELKHLDVVHAFRKAGLPDIKVHPVLSTDRTDGYRNKAQYPVAADKSGYVYAGFYAPHSHRVVSAEACPLQSPAFSPILSFVMNFCNTHAITAYNEQTGEGLLRHVYFRTSRDEKEILLTLVINGDSLPYADTFCNSLVSRFPNVVGILMNVNREKTNVICGREYKTLFGKSSVDDMLAGVSLSISPASFYQVNHDAAELLYAKAAALADFQGDETLLDLFCGIGSIGLSMASRVRRLVGIEIVKDAVKCAKENARRNGIRNAAFYAGDATDFLSLLEDAQKELGRFSPDVVVLDPPRKGCDEKLLFDLAEAVSPERIVYISHNPDTLARDVRFLLDHGYEACEAHPVDLFPRTGHCECIVKLSRQAPPQ